MFNCPYFPRYLVDGSPDIKSSRIIYSSKGFLWTLIWSFLYHRNHVEGFSGTSSSIVFSWSTTKNKGRWHFLYDGVTLSMSPNERLGNNFLKDCISIEGSSDNSSNIYFPNKVHSSLPPYCVLTKLYHREGLVKTSSMMVSICQGM